MSSRRVKLPSFQFYPGDWLRDAGLRACTVASRGLWMDLLCYMHDAPVRGHLLKSNGQPFTDAELSRATGCPAAQLTKHLAELESAGVFDRNEAGVIVSRRMAADEDARRQAAEFGKRGGNPELMRGKPEGLTGQDRPGQPDANRGDNPPLNRGDSEGISPSSSSSSSSSSPSTKEQDPPNPPPGGGQDGGTAKPGNKPSKKAKPKTDDPRFAEFWSVYPNKVAKDAAAAAFAKLDPSPALLDELLAALARQRLWPKWTKDGGQFIPHPATWLNQRRWEDQPPDLAAVPAGQPPPAGDSALDRMYRLANEMGLKIGSNPDPEPVEATP